MYLLLIMLEANGIPARLVNIYTALNISNEFPAHSVVEFYDGQKWLAIDPSYNIMFKNKQTGGYISYSEMYKLINEGNLDAIKYEIIGEKLNPRYTIEDAFLTYYNRMQYVFTASGIVYGDEPKFFPAHVCPEDWDGTVVSLDGRTLNLYEFAKFYESLQGRLQ